MSVLVAAAALLADAALGEPRRAHPLVGFGQLAQAIEQRLHPGEGLRPALSRLGGLLALVLAVLPPVLACSWVVAFTARLGWAAASAVEIAVLYGVVGHRSLREHAQQVAAALYAQDLPAARERVGRMVSRDTAQLDETSVAAAAVESVLENGSDAVFGALFWFAVAGAPAALAYRLVNTLDAMWGYRTPRYRHFGWAAARLDDAANWLPARLTALAYALAAGSGPALRCWRQQAAAWDSPNGGPVMAAGAGALGLQLGGAARYHGQIKRRPVLGEGRAAAAADIERSLALVLRALLVGLLVWAALEAAWSLARA